MHEQIAPILRDLRQSIGTRLEWTPDSSAVREVVAHFLTQEPGWIDSVIRRDPALYKHMGLADNDADLKLFLANSPNQIGTKELLQRGKVTKETLREITDEVMTYQGLHAIAFHRIAHELYGEYLRKKADGNRTGAAEDLLLARKISQGVRRLTAGIEIHPGATIGKHFFIDHGAGVVIGETAIIGDDVFLYHGVTLGASSGKEVPAASGIARRHPKIGNGVTISTGVNILGPVTVEDHVKIGTNALIKGDGALTVGMGAKIQDGVAVSKPIPVGAMVLGSVPELPGILEREQSGAPIMIAQQPRGADGTKPKLQILGDGLEHYARGVRAMSAAIDGRFSQQASGRS